ncbi:MAG: arsenosugar biosynthesis radical SAM protein ArsS [Deltaproteobacteria bacterium]|nr:arsenosugar biosynthesis radical SAM protein ArsS [Deltaproteobacteria bacterium]
MQTAPSPDPKAFERHLTASGLPALRRDRITTLQLNIGLRCNLACHHCHVESGPKRTERLDDRGLARILELLARNWQIETLDITGGAPELHPGFRDLVRGARALGRRVIDRCNLTILEEPGQVDTAAFLAREGVDIVASLPCYGPENVDAQRGRGVFEGSIRALKTLNALGYGQAEGRAGDRGGAPLRLDLVYNPVGAFLPPDQRELEAEYRERLAADFGIVFDRLLTLTNMPIQRFAHALARDGEYAAYMGLLVNHFDAVNLAGVMCRSLVSVGHDGALYDCDFNQALGLRPPGPPRSIFDVEDLAALEGAAIATGAHCFGCTAGAGSSCGGALR